MAGVVEGGPVTEELTRDAEGHRQYKVEHRVRTTSTSDGPQRVMVTPGLPAVGAIWAFGNDLDLWAYCSPYMRVTIDQEKKGDPVRFWMVEQLFSTKPRRRCQDETIEDPLLEPQKISGSFVNYTEEATKDRNGDLIQSSSHEQLRGPQVEFDRHRATVRIEQNTAALELATFTEMMNTVNDRPLWGLAVRKIKLSNVSWERLLYGVCAFYYKRVLDFDVDFKTFDRSVLDEGTKVLNGHWEDSGWVLDDIDGSPPDKTNPQHFIRAIDRHDNPIRVVLDGNGEPADDTGTDGPGEIDVEKYDESNFLLLGIPTSF